VNSRSGRIVRPLVGPPACCQVGACKTPLTDSSLAQAVVRHVLASTTTPSPLPVCRISVDDQAALASFIQRYPGTHAAEEQLLLCGSLFGLIRRQGQLRLHGYQGLAELSDFDQEGIRVVLEFVRLFDPRRAHAISTPLYLRLLRGLYILAGRLERHVALSGDMHMWMRCVSSSVRNAEIALGRDLEDREWQAIVEDVVRRRVTLETARAHRRFLRGGRYLSELTEGELDDAAARAAETSETISISPITEDQALEILTRDEVVRALSGLSKHQRERIAELIGLDGFGPHRIGELARLLRISRQAVHQAVGLGLRTLQTSRHRGELDQVQMVRRSLRRRERIQAD